MVSVWARRAGTRGSLGIAQRQCEEERAALPSFALRPDLPPVRLHDPFGDGEPQTGAQPGGLPRLPETLENMRELIRGDPGPGIGDREPDLAIGKLGPDGDCAAFGGELDRIPDQVREDPKDSGWIAAEAELPGESFFQPMPLLLGERFHLIQGSSAQTPTA